VYRMHTHTQRRRDAHRRSKLRTHTRQTDLYASLSCASTPSAQPRSTPLRAHPPARSPTWPHRSFPHETARRQEARSPPAHMPRRDDAPTGVGRREGRDRPTAGDTAPNAHGQRKARARPPKTLAQLFDRIGKSAFSPSAVWLIMPMIPNIAARPLLRSALSLKVLTSGSS